MKKLFPKTKMLHEAAEQSKGRNLALETIIFLVVLLVVELIVMIPMSIGSGLIQANNPEIVALVESFNAGEITLEEYTNLFAAYMMTTPFLLFQLYMTGITTLLIFVYCRFIEKRKLNTMGFRKSGWLPEYLVGMAVGTLMFSAAVGICLATGSLKSEGISRNINFGLLAAFFVGYLIQGMSEEVAFRGYFMVSLSRRSHIAAAVAVSSIAFGLAHLGNSFVTPLALINVALFGAFAGLYILKRGNIWGACGIHSLWNFVQGNVFGINVSGMINSDSIMRLSPVNSKIIVNGGDFGLEGGLAVTIVLVIGIIIISLTKTKQSEIYDEENAPVIEPAITD